MGCGSLRSCVQMDSHGNNNNNDESRSAADDNVAGEQSAEELRSVQSSFSRILALLFRRSDPFLFRNRLGLVGWVGLLRFVAVTVIFTDFPMVKMRIAGGKMKLALLFRRSELFFLGNGLGLGVWLITASDHTGPHWHKTDRIRSSVGSRMACVAYSRLYLQDD